MKATGWKNEGPLEDKRCSSLRVFHPCVLSSLLSSLIFLCITKGTEWKKQGYKQRRVHKGNSDKKQWRKLLVSISYFHACPCYWCLLFSFSLFLHSTTVACISCVNEQNWCFGGLPTFSGKLSSVKYRNKTSLRCFWGLPQRNVAGVRAGRTVSGRFTRSSLRFRSWQPTALCSFSFKCLMFSLLHITSSFHSDRATSKA